MSKKVYEVTVFDNGLTEWKLNGKAHHDDGPAVIWANGSKFWYRDGKLHRDDGPAAIYVDGTKRWFKNGERHREDGPAVIYGSGRKAWYLEGCKLSRAQWKKKVTASKDPCNGKTVEIDGRKYKLTAVE